MANAKIDLFSRFLKKKKRDNQSVAWLCTSEAYDMLCTSGYTRLSDNPEIMAAVGRIADLISSMTIHMMENTEKGDVRIKDGLSRKIDIDPNPYMTRKSLMYSIVRTMLLEGDGNAVVYPRTRNGLLDALIPVPASMVSFISTEDFGYRIRIGGREYDPSELLHFTCNPDPYEPWRGTGYQASLKAVAQNLKQAAETERDFLSSKYKPSVLVRVDAINEDLSTDEGKAKFVNKYLSCEHAGAPLPIPGDLLQVEQIKPLSLTDLALNESVTINKKTVASILGVPAYVVGAGDFKKEEWNNFINTTVMPLAQGIQQELSRKLLYSPQRYFRFNPRSLYAYDINELAKVADDQFVRGIMTGNEARDWLGLSPKEGLDELVILENYIPRGMIGDQKKLEVNSDNG